MYTYTVICYNIYEVNYMGSSYTASQRKAAEKYLSTLDEIKLLLPKGQKDIIRAHAESRGESVNAFIQRAIAETMARDGKPE